MRWLRRLFQKEKTEKQLDAELRFHLERQIADNVAAGFSAEEARRRASLSFGGLEPIKEDCREARRVNAMETLNQDVRYGLRVLRKSPGFTAVAVLTLALGIGASTAVFSVVNAILLKPLPYRNVDRIVLPWGLAPPGINLGYDEFPWSRVQFLQFQQETKTFQDFGAFQSKSFNLTGSGEPALLEGMRASTGFFSALGVAPAFGRTFTEEEDTPGHEHEVILKHELWRDRFGGDPVILGRTVELNGEPYTVVGIMPQGFAFPRAEEMPGSITIPHEVQLWVPLAISRGPIVRGEPSELAVIGRLKPGVTIALAQAELNVFTTHMESLYPTGKGWFNTRVTPLARQVVGDTRPPLLLLLGAVGAVLLIACSNVASLLMTRSLGRKREFTLRAALGAGHGRLVRQLLTESLLLAAAGGFAGVLLAYAGIYFVKIFGPSSIPRLQEVALDLRVFLFVLGITLLTGMLFGLAPALGAARENLVDSLKEGGQRSGGNAANPKMRNALLVSEVALALVLVVGAGLLVRTFFSLLTVDGGFNPTHVLTFELSLPSSKYADMDSIVTLYHKALQRLQSLPGVDSAGIGETIPINGAADSTVIVIPGLVVPPGTQRPYANYTIASPSLFSAVGQPVLRGREFLETDTADSQLVAIINSSLAKKYWPGEDPIGKGIGIPIVKAPMTIVGVVADVKHLSFREDPGPEMYVPYTQRPWPSMLVMQVAVRTNADPVAMIGSVREAIHSVDADLPVAKVTTLATLAADAVSQPRFSMLLLGTFAALALVLASIGMYGVISYSVGQRTREIGIRMALGAERRSVFGMILGQGARLAGLGISIGLLTALGVTHLMASFLFGVKPTDPLTFAGVSLLLLGVALLACYIPARRATRVDPMIALRYE